MSKNANLLVILPDVVNDERFIQPCMHTTGNLNMCQTNEGFLFSQNLEIFDKDLASELVALVHDYVRLVWSGSCRINRTKIEIIIPISLAVRFSDMIVLRTTANLGLGIDSGSMLERTHDADSSEHPSHPASSG
jgi:hypothetical protein